MSEVRVFRSMLSALTYVLGEHADHYFTLTEGNAFAFEDLKACNSSDPDVSETMAALARENGEAAMVEVGSETHYGYVAIHYTEDGEIVRFLGIK